MDAPMTEEIAEKLAQLKQYSREFDAHEAQWKATGGEKEAYQAMMLAERNYISLSDWLWQQNILLAWDKGKREYVIRNDKVLFKRLSQ